MYNPQGMPDLGHFLSIAFQRGQRSSALTPLLWLTAIVAAPSLYLCVRARGSIRVALFVLAALLVLAVLAAYAYLVARDPRLVQSESFQLESRRLDLAASKGGPQFDALLVDPTHEPGAPRPPAQLGGASDE